VAKKERELPAKRHDTGLGLSWGRLVHQVLEAVGSGRMKLATTDQSREDRAKLELFIENMLAADEGDFSDKEKLIDHIESILESEFWQRVMRAEKKYFEIPFAIRTSQGELAELGEHNTFLSSSGSLKGLLKSGKGGEAGQAGRVGRKTEAGRKSDGGGAGDLPVVVSGAIDLVFWEASKDRKNEESAPGGKNVGRTSDGQPAQDGQFARDDKNAQDGQPAGWVIVDYKTDKIPIVESDLVSLGPELSIDRIRAISPEFASIIDFYAPQIRLYTRFWGQITGEPVKESGIYFTSIHRWIRNTVS
jgi:ATP-dependent helicase/nuclease subunit A